MSVLDNANTIPSGILGIVESAIRSHHQSISRRGMVGKRSYTKRRGHLAKARHLHLLYSFAQTLGNEHRAFGVCLGQDYHKLVPTESRRDIDSSQFGAQGFREHAERNVTSLVTGLIVDVFETVKVEHD